MIHRLPTLGLAVLAALAGTAASAQSPQAPAEPAFRSAFDGYQPFRAQEVAPWVESNDTVGRIGGWRAYAREAHEASAPASRQAPAATPGAGTSDAEAAPPAAPRSGHGHGHHH